MEKEAVMEENFYPGYWSIDCRFNKISPAVVYRVSVIKIIWMAVDEGVPKHHIYFLVHREDERKIAWLLETQKQELSGVLQFKNTRKIPDIGKSAAIVTFMLAIPGFEIGSYQKVFKKISAKCLCGSIEAGVIAQKNVLVDEADLPLANTEAVVKFQPVVARKSELVVVASDYEPTIKTDIVMAVN